MLFDLEPVGNPEDGMITVKTGCIHGAPSKDSLAVVSMDRARGDLEEKYKNLLKAADAIGRWMSAAQDDPKVCAEMKEDIGTFFYYFDPGEVEFEEE